MTDIDKFLTEWLGEFWHEFTEHSRTHFSCSCGNLSHSAVRLKRVCVNPDFLTDPVVFKRLTDKMADDGGWEEFYVFYSQYCRKAKQKPTNEDAWMFGTQFHELKDQSEKARLLYEYLSHKEASDE